MKVASGGGKKGAPCRWEGGDTTASSKKGRMLKGKSSPPKSFSGKEDRRRGSDCRTSALIQDRRILKKVLRRQGGKEAYRIKKGAHTKNPDSGVLSRLNHNGDFTYRCQRVANHLLRLLQRSARKEAPEEELGEGEVCGRSLSS